MAQWTDLQQFAKQCVGYIDSHIMDDTDFYLKVSEAFSEILRQIRFYPYPAVLYKLAFNNYLLWGDVESKPIKKSEPKKEVKTEPKPEKKEEKVEEVKEVKSETKSDWDLWERVISQISSSTTRQVFKDHMTIDKVTDSEVSLIHDNNMIAKTMLEKEHKNIEALLEKELGKKVTLNIQWISKEEYFQRLMWKM